MAQAWMESPIKAPMSLEEARTLLDKVREGFNAPAYLITVALILTGDLPYERPD